MWPVMPSGNGGRKSPSDGGDFIFPRRSGADGSVEEMKRTEIMGIVNVTPDSFSDGGTSSTTAAALDKALRLLDEGADLIDVGGESTRPGALEVPAAEEIARVAPVIQQLKRLRPDCVISVDTRKSAVARAALHAGATIVNDVSGLSFSLDMAATAAAFEARLIIGHTRGTPERMRRPENCRYADVTAAVCAFWTARAEAAEQAGVKRENLLFDPCLGFAKTAEQDWTLLRQMEELRRVGPVLIGHSRKSFLGALLGEPEPLRREAGTLAVSLHALMHGAAMVRVHDVRATAEAFRVWRHLAGDGPENPGGGCCKERCGEIY